MGSKNRFLNNRGEFNTEAFYYDYKNYQLSFNNPTSGLQEIFNADKASVYGIDFSSQFNITVHDKLDATLEAHRGDYEKQQADYSPPFVKTNITLNYTSADTGWHAGLYVYNLENAASFGQGRACAGTYIFAPRTYGAKFGMKF